jgi:hypothetical protein
VFLAACRHPNDDKLPAPQPTGPEASADAGLPARGLVGEPITLDGSGSTGETFTWTLSDGQVAEGAVAEVTFDAPGHYSAVLEAVDAVGRSATDGTSVTVTWPVLADPPVAGSSVAVDGADLYAVLSDFDRVARVDLATRAVAEWLDTCDVPRSVAVGAGGVWVACEGDAVQRLGDPAIPLPVGSRPFAVVARGDDVLVTLQGTGAVARIAGGAVAEVVPVEPDVRGLAADADHVLVTRYRSPDDRGVVAVLDPDLARVGTVDLQVDPGPDSDTNSRGVPNLLQRPVIRPDGRVAAVPGSKANVERGVYRDGQALTFETTCRADLRQIDLSTDAEGEAAIFDDRDLAVAAQYSPDGDWLFVLHVGMETVDVLDAYTLVRAGAAEDVGSGADGFAVTGSELWVLAQGSRELRGFDVTSVAAPIPLGTVDLLPPGGEVVDAEVLHGRILFGRSVDPRIDTAGYLSCASCHPEGDHDGRTWDFTDRGEGLRNTISLRGHAGSVPIHWSANFDEVQDFENDIRGPMAGAGLMTDADFAATEDTLGAPKAGLSAYLDALAAYVISLDVPYASPNPPDPEGEALFLDPAVGCADCHPPPTYTDSAFLSPGVPLLHDVGTLGPGSGDRRGEPLTGLDTPTLIGLAGTAPYLHDGSAATLGEVLVDRNPADQHGVTSTLTATEVEALGRFLLSL